MSFIQFAQIRCRQQRFALPALCLFFFLSLILATPPACAQSVDYQVVLDVQDPSDERSSALGSLLEGQLKLITLRGNERIDLEQLQRMVSEAESEIATVLSTEGYYSAKISSSLVPSGPLWIARFQIAPNEIARVAEVRLNIVGGILDPPEDLGYSVSSLRSDWLLPAGSVFRHARWEAAKRALLQRLVLRGYPLADLRETRAEVDPATASVTLIVDLDSGPTVRFGGVQVTGLKRYSERIVMGANPTNVGDLYSQEMLLQYQRKLQDTEFFKRADVSAAPVVTDGKAIASIDVNLDEYPRQRVTLGAGYSTNTGNRLLVNYGRLNMFDRALRFDGTLRLETKQQLAQTDFIFAPNEKGHRNTLSALVKREDISGELVRSYSLYGRRAWGSDRTERNAAVGLIRERRDVQGVQTNSMHAAVASYGVIFRRTDNRLAPSRGYLLEAQVGAGLRIGNQPDPFTRAFGRVAWYRPLSDRNTLILRAEGGAIGARDSSGIPSEWLFRAGGDQSVRGYAYQSLGVKTASGAVVGGRFMATGSAEVVHWLDGKLNNWGAAAFIDAGNSADRLADLGPAFGYGIGARWRSPVGLLNLDLAYGQEVRKFRLHFALGVNF